MRFLILFLLLMPFTSALAVTPTTVSDNFLVINTLDHETDFIIKSGFYEERITLDEKGKEEFFITDDFSDVIYIYEIQDIEGLGVVNSIKINVDQEKPQRLLLDEVLIAQDFGIYWIWVLVGVIAISGVWIFRKQLERLIK
ncbi:hypothetical protein CL616_01570 [archaeon]|nr:hypothetical protein [archaeon]